MTEREAELEKEIEKLKIENVTLKNKIMIKLLHDTPVFVWHTKARDNTTIKFASGETITVHRAKGEVDSLETAIVYALAKHKYTKKIIDKLIKETKEVK